MTVPTYSLDFETTSACDIGFGAYRYAADPSTRILLFAIAQDNEAPVIWRIDEPDSPESCKALYLFRMAVKEQAPIRAFNVGFEAAICKYVLTPQLGIPAPALEQWRCTQFLARRSGLPDSLAKAAEFLKLGDQKNPIGKALIGVFSDQNKIVDLLPPKGDLIDKAWKKLKRPSASPILEDEIPWDWSFAIAGGRMTVREGWDAFIAYCRQDVVVERQVCKALAPFEPSPEILAGFHFDLRLNDRGVPVDVPMLKKAKVLIDDYDRILSEKFFKLTGLQPAQTAAVLKWLKGHGYAGNSLNADTVAEVRAKHADKLTEDGKKALNIRAALSFAAVKKVPAMLDWVCPDGRIRGAFTFCGAQKTGRWTSRGPQFQNMKKPSKRLKKVIARVYQMVGAEWCDLDLIEALYGNPYEVLASLSRYFVRDPDGPIYDVDFAQVEARILPALIGCERILDKFRRGEDIYLDVAKKLGVDRDLAKVVSLLCIAQGELVLTDQGLVPIEKVSRCHRVWDGVEWVAHEGVVCKGTKRVITYQGLRATEDHEVYCYSPSGQIWKIPFRVAAREQADLVVTGRGCKAVRAVHRDGSGNSQGPEGEGAGGGDVCVREHPTSGPGFVAPWDEPRLSRVPGRTNEVHVPDVATKSGSSAAATMHQSGGPGVSELRREGDRVSLPEHGGSLHLGHGEPRTARESDVGPDQQLRALRGGEPAMGDQLGAAQQHPAFEAQGALGPCEVALQQSEGDPVSTGRTDREGNLREGAQGSSREVQELAGDFEEVRVYDIVNAGPRHRFTVSDKLVSNCQFGGGWRAVKIPLKDQITEKEARKAVKVYREENPEVTAAWKAFDAAFLEALNNPGTWVQASPKVKFGYTLKAPFPRMLMRLPAGRDIVYPMPRALPITMWRKGEKDSDDASWQRVAGHLDLEAPHFHTYELEFWGHVKGPHYGYIKTYGGDLLQSATQGTGMDFLLHGCVKAEQQGFESFFVVHDQALARAVGGLKEYIAALCTRPAWFPDFPLEADGDLADSYQKS